MSQTDPFHPPAHVRTYVDLLNFRATEAPDRRMYLFLEDGEREGADWTRADLLRKARAVAAELQGLGCGKGDAALMVFPQGLDFVAALFGCLLAGVIGVPAPAPDPGRLQRTAPRLALIARDAGAKVVLIHSSLNELQEYLPPELPGIGWLVSDQVQDQAAARFVEVAVEPEHLAYLQYTSGSTSNPKGVMVTHANLVAHGKNVQRWTPHPSSGTMVSWLPLFHDFGLVYGLLHSLYAGCDAVILSPQAFIQRPLRWLEAISKYRGIGSPTPNFGLELCVTKSRPEEREKLDLSCWSLMNGSEPIHEDTEQRFAEAFACAKLQPRQILNAYGMAEATLVLSVEPKGTEPIFAHIDPDAYERNEVVDAPAGEPSTLAIASCGPPLPGVEIRIVNPDTLEQLADGRVGEVWVRGETICAGYWKNEEATKEIFGATIAGSGDGPFLRTGDLGFLRDGRIYISGRQKDLIIVHGANKHPGDIEWQIQSMHQAFRPNCGAAFGLRIDGEERLGFVSEVRPEHLTDLQAVWGAVWDVAAQNGLAVSRIALIQPKSLPKTSSGKLQRRLTRDLLLQGKLPVVAEWTPEALGVQKEEDDLRERLLARPKRAHGLLIDRLKGRVAAQTGIPADHVRPDRPLREQGLDSIASVEIVEWLERATRTELGLGTAFERATLDDLADLVEQRLLG